MRKTTVRGSFRALHRIVRRHLKRLRAPTPRPQAEARRADSVVSPRSARSVAAVVSTELHATALSPPLVPPRETTPPTAAEDDREEAHHEQIGFVPPNVPAPPNDAAPDVTARISEPEFVQAPHTPGDDEATEEAGPHDTPSLVDGGDPAKDMVQQQRLAAKPLSSVILPREGVEAGNDTRTPGYTTGNTALRTSLRPSPSGDAPPTARDAAALQAVARLRMLSYAQLRRRHYPGHPSKVGRRMQKLADAGWVVLFMDRLTEGGHPFYVFPTVKTMRWARAIFLGSGASNELLVRTMFPRASSTVYTPEPRTAPTFLRHQELTNDVAEILERSEDVAWLSSWPRPFPHAFRGVALPQPDLVFVTRTEGSATLFFGELDHNANESVAHFRDRKAVRAVGLAHSGLLPPLTGFDSFVTLVVVAGGPNPMKRITTLMDAAEKAYAGDLLAFTFLPWLQQQPCGRIWFSAGTRPQTEELTLADHGKLLARNELATRQSFGLGHGLYRFIGGPTNDIAATGALESRSIL